MTATAAKPSTIATATTATRTILRPVFCPQHARNKISRRDVEKHSIARGEYYCTTAGKRGEEL